MSPDGQREKQEKKLEQDLDKKSARNIMIEVGFAQAHFGLLAGVFFIGYLILLGANNFEIGLLSAFPVMASLFSPVFSHYIDKYPKRKTLVLNSSLVARLTWFLIAAIPLLTYYNFISRPLIYFGVLYFLNQLFFSFTSISWIAWMADIIPESKRGHYFGRRNYIASFVAIFLTILGGRYLDFFKKQEALGFSSLFTIASIFGLISYFVLSNVREAKNVTCVDGDTSLKDIPGKFLAITKNKVFMRLSIFNASWALIMTLSAIYMPVYLIRELKMSYTSVTVLTVIALIFRVLVMKYWGKIVDKYGSKPVIHLTGQLVGFLPFIWCMVGHNSIWLLIPLNLLAGSFWPGFELAQFNLLLKLSPKKERASYIAFNNVIVGICAFIGPVIGGFLIDRIGDWRLQYHFINMGSYQLLFFAVGILRSFPVRYIKGIYVPKEEKLEKVQMIIRTTFFSGLVEGAEDLVVVPIKKTGHFIKHIISTNSKSEIRNSKKR